ncbi:metallophosphoesterase [Polycladidibacter stylochi]|uniref:metallophosphoesterase n=1 Tax=Polycladidibacter stylochi TaxID=1807766 RepID=UPI000836EBCB|nr:metallophosphoesterase [Pseudovibrio stylochi]
MAFFFTADPHFGHENIINLCRRPFKDSDEQTSQLIANWNSIIGEKDHVFVLGDFAHRAPKGSLYSIFSSLNGRKSLIKGNHDHSETLSLPWVSHDPNKPQLAITDQLTVKINRQPFFLCHYAMRTWPAEHQGAIHLFGHSHGNLPDHNQSTDVGVDCWNYMPVSALQLQQKFTAKSKR